MNKDMIIYEVNNVDLYDLNSNQLKELKNEIKVPCSVQMQGYDYQQYINTQFFLSSTVYKFIFLFY